MTQMAPEAPAPARGRPARRENVFTRHIGPLPMWGWLLIAVGMIGIYYVWHRNSAASAASTPSGTNASQVPQFVNQTYTTVTPPTAPPVPAPTPSTTPTGTDGDLYYHAHPKGGRPYASKFGHPFELPAGSYSIGGKSGYYYHAAPAHGKPYWTLGGKRVHPPSGAITRG